MRFERAGIGGEGLLSKGFEDVFDLCNVGHELPSGEVFGGVAFLQEFAGKIDHGGAVRVILAGGYHTRSEFE